MNESRTPAQILREARFPQYPTVSAQLAQAHSGLHAACFATMSLVADRRPP